MLELESYDHVTDFQKPRHNQVSLESMKWDLRSSQSSSEQLSAVRNTKKQSMLIVHKDYEFETIIKLTLFNKYLF